MKTGMHKQQGMVLIVALIMLMAMTLIGVSSMTTSSLEERMAANTRDRHIAFQAAEATLREGERHVQGNSMNPATFTTACTNGLCDCDPLNFTSGPCPEYWTDTSLNVWNTGNYRTYTNAFSGTNQAGRYIIEFVGNVCPTDSSCTPTPADPQMFRVTAIGYGQTPNSKVMLQSTYKKQ